MIKVIAYPLEIIFYLLTIRKRDFREVEKNIFTWLLGPVYLYSALYEAQNATWATSENRLFGWSSVSSK
jgi:hypothetical protein